MSARGAWHAIVVGLVLLAALAVPAMWPVDANAYRDTTVKAAQGGLSGARTAQLVADAHLRGRITGPYTTVVLQDARTATATALSELADSEVPDAPSARLRDQLSPLLVAASAAVADAGTAIDNDDDAALRAVQRRLTKAGDDLEAYVDGHR